MTAAMWCPRIRSCLFFSDRLGDRTRFAVLYKYKYCMNDFASCARYQVAQVLGNASVPDDLLPGEKDKADFLIMGS